MARVFELLVAMGLAHRVIYDRLYELDHYVGFDFLSPSTSRDPLRRGAENEHQIRAFVDILLRRRGQQSLSQSPLTEDWTMKACWVVR